jgi:phosphopantothenoylcysteine decarboxylase/phosphopantothenate--cysteine ligase
MSAGAQQFVAPLTLQTLSGNPVATDTFSLTQESEIGHINLADEADVVVVAPATANLIARLRAGMADDAVTTTALACEGPFLVAPAMNTRMWQSAAVRENVRELARRGWHVVGPASGQLADGDVGEGRLAEPEDIAAAAARLLGPRDLVGRRVVVTAGPTRDLGGEPRALDGHARDRFVYAPVGGVLRTDANIAQRVAAGETVATIGDEPLRAPLAGILRGLVHDGVPVDQGAKVVEIDPRADPAKVFGIGPRPRRIAQGVREAIAARAR